MTAENPHDPSPDSLRKEQLERLGIALMHFAATHNGRFPNDKERVTIAAESWAVPESGGLHYQYVPNRTADGPAVLLAYSPEVGAGGWLILKSDGSVETVTTDAFERLRAAGGRS